MLHPVHVTFLSIDYVPENKSVSLFLKIYYDDFLLDAGISQTDKPIQDSLRSENFLKGLITRYTNEKVKISFNNQLFSANLDDYVLSDNELRVNFSIPVNRKISTVAVRNMIMTRLYNDQSNMVIVKVNDFEEGIKLTPDKTEQTFVISNKKKE